jgi:hypothetical protein
MCFSALPPFSKQASKLKQSNKDDSYIGDSYQLYGEILWTRIGTFDACFGSHVNKEADTSEMDADHVLTRPYILF